MRATFACIVTLGSLAAPALAADEKFFQEAAQAGMAEVALGRLAATKASQEGVKTFARKMVDEHGAANASLKAAAASSGVTLPTTLADDAQAKQKSLEARSGADFDLAYLDGQRKAHARTIELLKTEIASGEDPAAKAWAREVLPTVQRHVEMIGSVDEAPGEHVLEHAVGVPGPAAAPPGAPAQP